MLAVGFALMNAPFIAYRSFESRPVFYSPLTRGCRYLTSAVLGWLERIVLVATVLAVPGTTITVVLRTCPPGEWRHPLTHRSGNATARRQGGIYAEAILRIGCSIMRRTP